MQRILIIGCSGAGKSTLARQMGDILRLPVVHLDREYWQPGWRARPDAEFDRIMDRLVDEPYWIMDGNFARTMAVRLRRADLVVHLDFPRWRCLWRICKRVLLSSKFDHSRPDMAQGCGEQWDWEFIEWVWHFRGQTHPKNLELLLEFANRVRVITLRTPADVQQFLLSLESAMETIGIDDRVRPGSLALIGKLA